MTKAPDVLSTGPGLTPPAQSMARMPAEGTGAVQEIGFHGSVA